MALGGDYVITETHNQVFNNIGLQNVDTAIVTLSQFNNVINTSEKKLTGIVKLVENAGKLITDQFSIDAIVQFGVDSAKAYQTMRSADAENSAALNKSGGAVGRTLSDLKTSANALSKTTLFDPASTAGAQASIQAFTNIKGAIFDQAIPAIQDMSQSMGIDLKDASGKVGKALNDPISGIKELSSVGVEFSKSQQDAITTMVNHNDVAGAQAIILGELNNQFGGSAVAAREAAGGQADFDMSVKNLQVGIGGLITNGLDPVFNAMTSFIEQLQLGVEWLSANTDVLMIVGEVLAVVGGGYLAYQGYVLALQAPMTIFTAGQWLLNAALSANPIGVVIGLIAGAVGGVILAYKHFETFRAVIDGVIAVGRILGDVFMGVGKIIVGALSFNPSMFMEGVKDSIKVAKTIADGGIQNAYKKGHDESLAKSASESREKATAEAKEKAQNELLNKGLGTGKRDAASSLVPVGTTAYKQKGSNPSAAGGLTEVAGNKQVRNVQVTIGKLVENLTVATTNLQGNGSLDIKRMITEILTGAVYDSELALATE